MAKVPVVDMSRCSMCEGCVELCPDIFRINEAGYIEVLEMDSYSDSCVQEAVNCCPVDCITWEEE